MKAGISTMVKSIKRKALAKAKPLLKRNGKTNAWRRDKGLITWLENL